MARSIFADRIRYERVRLTRDRLWATFAPVAIRRTVHLKSSWGHFQGSGLSLTPSGLQTLIHELGHVWQYENGGLAYIPKSLWAQGVAWLRTGDRGGAYRWREPLDAGQPWASWNPEQQAQAIEDFFAAQRRVEMRQRATFDARTLRVLEPCIAKVRRGEGAPRFW
ncbi:MAG: hypothetical protein AAFV53_43125 [Myxococcota bacterium]